MDSGRGDEVVELSASRGVIEARATPIRSDAVEHVLAAGEPPHIWWCPRTGPPIAGAGAAATIRTDGPTRFDRVREWAASVSEGLRYDGPVSARPRFFGGFSFDPSRPSGPWDGFSAGWFVLPAWQLVRADGETWLTVMSNADRPDVSSVAECLESVDFDVTTVGHRAVPTLSDERPVPSREEWLANVQTIKGEIAAGRLRKVVLGHTIEAQLSHAPEAITLARRLQGLHPECFRFVISPDADRCFIGASPERLVEASGRTLRTEALAGSRRRGASTEADEDLAASLRNSGKDTFEHDLVVEAITDRLTNSCSAVESGPRTVRQLASVQHLHTPITATRSSDRHLLDVAAQLHPTPAVGGLPRARALETLDRVETFERGWYAGPIGWFDASGDGQFVIGIRSAVVQDRAATMYAGAGIVGESDPAEEWAELQLKYQPIRETFRER